MKRKIVVVDDEPDVRMVLSSRLTLQGFDVIAASDGLEGIDKVKQEKPDLILLDVRMPGVDGIEVCRRLKANQDTATIPVVFLTAKATLEDQSKGANVGASDYVTKPYDPQELVDKINRILETTP